MQATKSYKTSDLTEKNCKFQFEAVQDQITQERGSATKHSWQKTCGNFQSLQKLYPISRPTYMHFSKKRVIDVFYCFQLIYISKYFYHLGGLQLSTAQFRYGLKNLYHSLPIWIKMVWREFWWHMCCSPSYTSQVRAILQLQQLKGKIGCNYWCKHFLRKQTRKETQLVRNNGLQVF